MACIVPSGVYQRLHSCFESWRVAVGCARLPPGRRLGAVAAASVLRAVPVEAWVLAWSSGPAVGWRSSFACLRPAAWNQAAAPCQVVQSLPAAEPYAGEGSLLAVETRLRVACLPKSTSRVCLSLYFIARPPERQMGPQLASRGWHATFWARGGHGTCHQGHGTQARD
jgi:hypothetical protein